jgi:ribosome biogenesis GTPase
MSQPMLKGIVFKSTGSWYRVRLNDDRFLDCRVRGKMKLGASKITNPVTVGDEVILIEDENHEGTGIIQKVVPRQNYVIRKSVHKTAHGHMIAANIDQAMLIVTVKNPRTSLGFIDRFLVSTEAFRIPTLLVFNKLDLYDDDDFIQLEEIIEIYEQIGVQCRDISAKKQIGIDKVKDALKGKITLISGHSGTGKSTLINLLDPKIDQSVGEISTFADKGVHTTTFAEMFEIDKDTYVIDTPGIKELGLIDIDNAELSDYFPEMRALIGACKFHNCSHVHEPKCAIRHAVDVGEISSSRYYNYLGMLEDVDTRR